MIGIMGGTFDPIHNGHLRIAEEAAELFDLENVLFVPAKQSPLKARPTATAQQRSDWVRVAIKTNRRFSLDERELTREGESYTVDTLRELSQEQQGPLLFIMGVDAFNHFDSWKSWQDILSLTHLLVCDRPQSVLRRPRWSQSRWSKTPQELQSKKTGNLYLLSVTPMPVSSTLIRQKSASQQSIRYLVPDEISEEINQQQIYLPPKRS